MPKTARTVGGTPYKDLAARVEKLEAGHKQHGRAISLIVKKIDDLKSLPDPKNKRIM